MSATIQRRLLTATVLGALRELGPCGDSVIPPGGGWNGPANSPTSAFIPYLALSTLTAKQSSGDLSIPQGDWQMPYLVQAYNISREGCEWMADAARNALASLVNTVLDLGDAHYKVQQVWTDSIGGVNRVPEADPPFFGQQDGATVWLSKKENTMNANITMSRGKDQITVTAGQVRVLEDAGWKTDGPKTALKQAAALVDGTSDTPMASELETAAALAAPDTATRVAPPS